MDNSDKNKRVALYESNKFLQPIHPKQFYLRHRTFTVVHGLFSYHD